MPEAEVLEGEASGPKFPIDPEVMEEVHDEALLESSMDVVIRSLETQDAEPILSAPMLGAATTSYDGLELLADDLVNPATVACNLESTTRRPGGAVDERTL
jgi:hypothetical protein